MRVAAHVGVQRSSRNHQIRTVSNQSAGADRGATRAFGPAPQRKPTGHVCAVDHVVCDYIFGPPCLISTISIPMLHHRIRFVRPTANWRLCESRYCVAMTAQGTVVQLQRCNCTNHRTRGCFVPDSSASICTGMQSMPPLQWTSYASGHVTVRGYEPENSALSYCIVRSSNSRISGMRQGLRF